ncbi:MAG: hypothetical protein M1510_09120 [Nitrospirae bacterium]|nr:hypothetical protein [Nitrospirota bacterium]
MIYIEFQRERLFIDLHGNVIERAELTDSMPVAVLTDASAIKDVKDTKSHRYYIKHNDLFYLDTKMLNKNTKSLLQVLNAREGAIVGLYFARRLLIFTYIHGLVKWRFSSDDIENASDIIYPIREWGLPQNVQIEVYGANIPFEKLHEHIVKAAPFRDSEREHQRYVRLQYAASVAIVVFSMAVFGGVRIYESHINDELKRTKAEISRVKREIRAEAFRRLPLYLESINIPLDDVFRSLSFLEGVNYSGINIVAEKDRASVTVAAQSSSDAYRITRAAERNRKASESKARISIKAGGGNIEITLDRTIEKDSRISDHVDYGSLLNIQ